MRHFWGECRANAGRWRREVRLGMETCASISKKEGVPISTVDGLVFGDNASTAIDGEPPLLRENPGKTVQKLTDDEVRALRRGEAIGTKISRATKSKILSGKIYKWVE